MNSAKRGLSAEATLSENNNKPTKQLQKNSIKVKSMKVSSENMSKEVGKLEQEALKRRERLKNLKRKFEGGNEEKSANDENSEEPENPIPKPTFRSYKKDEETKNNVDDVMLPDVTEKIQGQLDDMQNPLEVKDIDISNLAPRKVDFDLKRAISKKLLKLEKKTQKAISELIRTRLNDQQDLLESVNVGAQQSQEQKDDEDVSD